MQYSINLQFMKSLILLVAIFITAPLVGQSHINSNGVNTSVVDCGSANNIDKSRRYEVASLGYNSFNWQEGGIILVELFQYSYGETGYERYSVEVGYRQGSNIGQPVVNLLESEGISHNATVTLGESVDLKTQHSGNVNKVIPIYVDVLPWTRYKVRLTYLQTKVENVSEYNQIKINDNPQSSVISQVKIPSSLKINKDQLIDGKLYANQDVYATKNIQINNGSMLGVSLSDKFTYDNKPMGQYALRWGSDSSAAIGPVLWQSAYGGMKFFTNGKSRMVLHHDGNVGIGTDSPKNKLDVAGTIRATEVKVETGWADFVFDKDYKLSSLEEVESHIKKYKRLPDIPSEAQVKEEGVGLGEMQVKLLQKIEELTLYVIEQNKKLETQSHLLNEQHQRIQELENINK